MLNDADLENNWDDVVLLLPFNTSFVDAKNNYGPTSTSGSPSITDNQYEVRFGNGAAKFNGNNDTARFQHGADTTIGTGNFTIEMWVRPTRFGIEGGGATSNTIRGIFSNHTVYSTTSTSRTLILRMDDNKLYLQVAGIALGNFFEMAKDRWHHIAVCREDTNLRFFVDGDLIHTYTGATYNFSTNTFVLGGVNYATNAWGYFPGTIDDFRFTKGFARYNEDFSPPAAAYPVGNTVRTPVNFFPQVRLLASEGIGNVSYSKRDINNRRHPPSISTDRPFFGNSESFYFNRSVVTTFPDDDYRIGTNDLTIEAWINIDPGDGSRTICASYGYPTRNNFWFGTSGNQLHVRYGQSSIWTNGGSFSETFTQVDANYTGRIPYGKWTHVAWSRRGSTNRIFINGKVAKTFNNQSNWTSRTVTFGQYARLARTMVYANISSWPKDTYQEGGWFTGYMNDIKFSNRVCKYTSDFNPFRVAASDRAEEFSLFDRNRVPTRSFDTQMVVRIDTDAETNNNVFWFNDDSGFILQKPASNVPGIRLNTAVINSSNELVLTLTSGASFNLGNITGQPADITTRLVGTGVLKQYADGVFTFVPLVGKDDVRVLDIDGQKAITSRDYSKGTSFDSMVQVGAFFEQGTSYSPAPVANTWTPVQINTIGHNTVGAEITSDYKVLLPAGTYYIAGDSTHYGGAFSQIKLVDETLGRDLAGSAIDYYSGTISVETHIEGHFTLYTTSKISLQILNTTASTGIAAPANGPTPQHNYMIFKVA